ncbi:MAG TPA: class II glutamine amidotransferase [Erysipelotrichaceae bacterium]|jgi:predicted glutamine amidotransferase|nr:class II glutamine amidotransferase [Erysipelotrichia bacterium]HPX32955.1 class II glutamine amidotransferase [Erysipelotrichaceae bacterium]HQA85497.1 class II glutamine amidotransferase [Erysipelotrichaceae bacterium]
MCEMFAYIGEKTKLNLYLNEFFSHSEKHPHGWGLAIGYNVEKEPVKANDSTYLKHRLQETIETGELIAHIRNASVGSVNYLNTHPFTKEDKFNNKYVLTHNGTINEYKILDEYKNIQVGSTDSERIAELLIDKINEFNYSPSFEEKFSVIENLVFKITENNRNKVNLFIYDGQYLYAHCNFDTTLHILEKDDGVFIATKPVSNENWKQFPLNTLVAFKNGKWIKKGTSHKGIWIPVTEEEIYWSKY